MANNPADRWRDSDAGIHVMAAGLYGLLRDDRWMTTGGNFEEWLGRAASKGRLTPTVFHPMAHVCSSARSTGSGR